MFKKSEKNLMPIDKLFFNKIRVETLDMDWCSNWLEYNRVPRSFFPEWFCIIAPATKKYVTDMLGYTYPDNFEATHSAVIVITDKMMKHIYAHNLVEYQSIDGQLSSLFSENAFFRISLLV